METRPPPLDLDALPIIDYERHPAYAALFATLTDADHAGAKEKFEKTLLSTKQLIATRSFTRPPPEAIDRPDLPFLREYLVNGVVPLRMPAEIRTELKAVLADKIAELRSSKHALPQNERTFFKCLAPLKDPETSRLVENAATATGALEMARIGMRKPDAAINGCFLYITDEKDYAVTHLFEDVGIPDPRAVSLHTDSTYRNAKLMVYLNEVRVEQGPFKYICGSHRMAIDPGEHAIRITNDKILGHRTDPEARKFICSLPPEYRLKGQFGNDLRDDDPIVEKLLRSELTLTSDLGDLILFDNTGLHRGALATSGERIAIQVRIE